MKFQNDDEILEALRAGNGRQREAAYRQLHGDGKLLGAIRKEIAARGGNEDDAREMRNFALLEFGKNVAIGVYDPGKSGIVTYIVSIAKQRFFTIRRSELRRIKRYQRSVEEGNVESSENPDHEINRQHRKDLMDRILTAVGEKCKQALRLYVMEYQMVEIAEKLNYKNADVAKAAIYDCKKRLYKLFTDQPELVSELRQQ